MIASAVTGSLNELGGYSLAFSVSAGSALLGFLVMLPLKDKEPVPRRPSGQGIGRLISRRALLLPALFNGIILYTDYATAAAFTPVLAKDLGATDVALSLLMSAYIGVAMLGNLSAMTVERRLGPAPLIRLSFALVSVGLLGLAIAPSVPLIYAAQFCIGFGGGLGYPVIMGMSTQQVGPGEQCTAMGLHQAIGGLGLFAGPWLSGVLADAIGIRTTFGATALVCVPIAVFGASLLVKGRSTDGDVSRATEL